MKNPFEGQQRLVPTEQETGTQSPEQPLANNQEQDVGRPEEKKGLESVTDEIKRFTGGEQLVHRIDASVCHLKNETHLTANKIGDASITVEGGSSLEAGPAHDSLLRIEAGAKASIESINDSLTQVKGELSVNGLVENSLIRVEESAKATIAMIKDAVVRVKAGGELDVEQILNCIIHIEKGAKVNIKNQVDSMIREVK